MFIGYCFIIVRIIEMEKKLGNNHNIKMAAKLSGVPELLIRAWEGRYSAISPSRTSSNRRIYSDSDIDKLILLRKLTQQGYRIGNLAQMDINDLIELLKKTITENNLVQKENKYSLTKEHLDMLDESILAVKKYDDKELTTLLNQAAIKFPQQELIGKVIIPLIEKIGENWKLGLLRTSHEHFTSAVLVKFLNNLSEGYKIDSTAPKIIITTPDGQYHEVGALIGSALAASLGWKPIYLGASLPAEDIASATKDLNARCVFLSLVYPNDNPKLNAQLKKLRELVGENVFIIASGNAISGYIKTLSEIGANITETPEQFEEILNKVREQINPNNREEL